MDGSQGNPNMEESLTGEDVKGVQYATHSDETLMKVIFIIAL